MKRRRCRNYRYDKRWEHYCEGVVPGSFDGRTHQRGEAAWKASFKSCHEVGPPLQIAGFAAGLMITFGSLQSPFQYHGHWSVGVKARDRISPSNIPGCPGTCES
ncbi:hypothetical protein STEG23_018188 [Scotinomys teguina]